VSGASVCGCGHEHTGGRVGSCSKFTCPCNTWHPPEEEGDRNVSPRPESARPESVAEGVATGSPSSSGVSASGWAKPCAGPDGTHEGAGADETHRVGDPRPGPMPSPMAEPRDSQFPRPRMQEIGGDGSDVGAPGERVFSGASASRSGAVLLSPPLDCSPSPDAPGGKFADGTGEVLGSRELVGALFADAQDGGDLGYSDEFHLPASYPLTASSARRTVPLDNVKGGMMNSKPKYVTQDESYTQSRIVHPWQPNEASEWRHEFGPPCSCGYKTSRFSPHFASCPRLAWLEGRHA
jgi:hypothetical protein